jgi:hypothetical protein
VRYQGIVTKEGARLFECRRRMLANMAGLSVDAVSDGAVFEYMARGNAQTMRYLKRRRK